MQKATNGQPPQRIQRGTPRPWPWRLAHSLSAPSGQNRPHQRRPNSTIDSSTNGHQMPQNTNCANTARSSNMRAWGWGRSRHAGTISNTA
ncbi:hypothetical protein D3C81_1323340 [compost metagenome]